MFEWRKLANQRSQHTKKSVVYYDCLRPFRRKPSATDVPTGEKTSDTAAPTSNVPIRNRTVSSHTPQNEIDFTHCTEWPSLPKLQHFLPSTATPSSCSNLPIPCPTPEVATPPIGNPQFRSCLLRHSRMPITQNKPSQSRQCRQSWQEVDHIMRTQCNCENFGTVTTRNDKNFLVLENDIKGTQESVRKLRK